MLNRTDTLLAYWGGVTPTNCGVVTASTGGPEIWAMDPLQVSTQWRFKRIALPAQTREIVVEARDVGAGEGEWHTIDTPRALGR